MKKIITSIMTAIVAAGASAALHPDSISARMERQLLEYPQEAIIIDSSVVY